MVRIAIKAMVIQFTDGKCHIKQQKSHKTALSGYYACVSCDPLLIPSGADTYTHMHAYRRTNKNDFSQTRLV